MLDQDQRDRRDRAPAAARSASRARRARGRRRARRASSAAARPRAPCRPRAGAARRARARRPASSSLSPRPTAAAIARPRSRSSASRRSLEQPEVPRRGRRARPGRGCRRRSARRTGATSGTCARARSRARLRAGSAVTSSPNSSTVPAVGGNSPEIRLNSVVLPAPLGPRIARRSPGRTSRSTPDTAIDAAEAPADPPQAEDRRGAVSGCRGELPSSYWPNETSSALPTHGGASPFSHFGLLRSGAGVSGEKKPPKVWSTSGIRRNVCDVRHAVAGLVGDDLLHEHVRDRLAVVVERDVAPRRLVTRQRRRR